MSIQKPEGMAADVFAELVSAVDILDGCHPGAHRALKALLSEHCAAVRTNAGLRGTVTQLKALRDDLMAERDDLEKQLEVKTDEARGLADQVDAAKRELEDRTAERDYERNQKIMAQHEAGRLEAELQDRREFEKGLPSPRPSYTDQATLNELAFGTSTRYLREKLIHMAEDLECLTPIQSAIIAAAGDRLGVDTWPSRRQLKRRPVPKGELANAIYPEAEGFSVDCAVPLVWLDKVWALFDEDNRQRIEKNGGLAAQFATVYQDEDQGGFVLPVTRCGIEVLAAVAHGYPG